MLWPELFLYLKDSNEGYGKPTGLQNIRYLVKESVTRKDHMLCQENVITYSGGR